MVTFLGQLFNYAAIVFERYRGNISPRFSRNSEAYASEFLEILGETFALTVAAL